MKSENLKKGVKYWCGWASRYGYFKEIRNRKAIFLDLCDVPIECELELLDRWVKLPQMGV